MSYVEQIIEYENGNLNESEIITLFQTLIDTGAINSLQGSYQREALRLITSGKVV